MELEYWFVIYNIDKKEGMGVSLSKVIFMLNGEPV